ncbi:MAG TPA: dicarboxylate/amino acid:cation symporter [Methylophilaceae bacterium]|nr:dicarboxylate/amino acid:cation symporter [Methylophilaceae bacterium]
MKLPSLNRQILIAAVVGLGGGWALTMLPQDDGSRQAVLYGASLVGGVFIDLLKMILIPLVFTSIVVGVANLRAHEEMHRVWRTTLLFFFTTMAIAVLLAFTTSHVFRPGAGMHLAMFQEALQGFQASQMQMSEFFTHFLHGLFVNPVKALAEGNVLAVVIFALFLGIALVMGGDRYQTVLRLFEEGLQITLRIVGWVMLLAPVGILALLLKLAATQDITVLASMGQFIAMVLGVTLLHGIVVLPLILYLVTGVSPLRFWRGAREALITAFATSSSSATLPVTMRCAQTQLGVRQDIAGFVIPLGATINMDGTALYEAAAALFIANLVGIDLSLSQQLIVFFTAMIASIGAPGIPSAGMVTMVMVLQSVGLPAEAIAILLPIDRLLDTFRTTVNVEGDMVGSLVVQKLVDRRS